MTVAVDRLPEGLTGPDGGVLHPRENGRPCDPASAAPHRRPQLPRITGDTRRTP